MNYPGNSFVVAIPRFHTSFEHCIVLRLLDGLTRRSLMRIVADTNERAADVSGARMLPINKSQLIRGMAATWYLWKPAYLRYINDHVSTHVR